MQGSDCGAAVRRTRSAAAVPILRFSSLARGAAGECSDRRRAALASGEEPDANLAVQSAGFTRLNSSQRRRKGNYGAVVNWSARPRRGRRCRARAPGTAGAPGSSGTASTHLPVPPVPPVPFEAVAVPCSMTVARMSISPFGGTVVAVGKMVMTLPVGARSGSLSHARPTIMAETDAITRATDRWPKRRDCADCGNIVKPKYNTLMRLQGQSQRAGEAGYAMATLLVALAVMSVLMSAVLPAWRHQARREKEAELAFRGEQYMRAIQLWERKMGPGSRPPNIDMLVQQKFLRKKYKDPMTEDGEFQPVFAGGQSNRAGAGPRRSAGSAAAATSSSNPADAGPDCRRRHPRRDEQEQGNVDPDLQRRDSIQRVAIHPRGCGHYSWRPRWQSSPRRPRRASPAWRGRRRAAGIPAGSRPGRSRWTWRARSARRPRRSSSGLSGRPWRSGPRPRTIAIRERSLWWLARDLDVHGKVAGGLFAPRDTSHNPGELPRQRSPSYVSSPLPRGSDLLRGGSSAGRCVVTRQPPRSPRRVSAGRMRLIALFSRDG